VAGSVQMIGTRSKAGVFWLGAALLWLGAAWSASAWAQSPAQGEVGQNQVPPVPQNQPPAAELPDIEILGVRPAQADRIDRRVYNIVQDELAQSSTAVEVIGRLPSVTVTASGNVTLLGQGSANVLIDGRPVAGLEQLRALLGADIEQVEVMTNPSSEFRAQGTGGVINVVTRRRRPIGLSGNLLISADTQENYRVLGSGSATVERWTWSSNAAIEQTSEMQARTRARKSLVPSVEDLLESLHYSQSGRSLTFGASAIYAHDENRSVTLGGSHGRSSSRSESRFALQVEGPSPTEYYETLAGRGEFESMAGNLEIDIRTPDRRMRTRFSASVTSTDFASEDQYSRSPPPSGIGTLLGVQSRQSIRQITLTTSLEYDPTEHLVFKGGLSLDNNDQSIERATRFSGLGPGASLLAGDVSLWSAWGSVQWPVVGWTVLPGLRAERAVYAIDLPSLDRPDEFDLFPSLHLRRPLHPEWTVNLSYSRRVNRPDLGRLDPTVVFTTATEAAVGAPYLRSEFTDALEAKLEHVSGDDTASATFYHRVTNDTWQPSFFLGADDVVLQTIINAGDRINAGLEVTTRRAISSRLRLTATANVFNSEQDVMVGPGLRRNSSTQHSISLALAFKPGGSDPMSDTFQWSARYSGASRGYQTLSSSSFQASISWRRPLTDRLVSVLTVSDIFDTGDQSFELITPTFRQTMEAKGLGPQIRWTLTRRFGGQQ
jgi:hypothetical protein